MNISIDFYKQGETYNAYISDNQGGSGIKAQGNNSKEFIQHLIPYLEDYIYQL